MKRRTGSHNIKQNEDCQSVQSSLITTIKGNKRVQTKSSVMAIVSLAKSTKWKHDPPMKRQNVCETHSNGTKSPNEKTLCVGKLLNRNESTWYGGSSSGKKNLFIWCFNVSTVNQKDLTKSAELCIKTNMQCTCWKLTITDSLNYPRILLSYNYVTNLLNPIKVLITEPLCCNPYKFWNWAICKTRR